MSTEKSQPSAQDEREPASSEQALASEAGSLVDTEDPNAHAGSRAQSAVPIVGIGASAGGLAAFEAFFSGMPAGTQSGMAFVLVQHLSPDRESMLSELVRRYTSMDVYDVEDGMKVQPDCAYIIPPNRDMALLGGTLRLLDPAAPRGLRSPIDFFFRSLAQDQGDRAICIVLSGAGSDGTLGVRAVKGEGGMAMVQKPDSTEYDGHAVRRFGHRIAHINHLECIAGDVADIPKRIVVPARVRRP